MFTNLILCHCVNFHVPYYGLPGAQTFIFSPAHTPRDLHTCLSYCVLWNWIHIALMPADSSHPEALRSDVEWKAELVVLNPLAELPFQCSSRKNHKPSFPGTEKWEVTFSSEHTMPCWGLQSPQKPALLSGVGSWGEKKGESPLPFPFPHWEAPVKGWAIDSSPSSLSSSTRPRSGGAGPNHNCICIIHFTFLSSAVVFWTCQVASWPCEPRHD